MMMMMIWCLFLSPSFYYGGSSCNRWYSSSNFVKDSPWVSILSLKVSKAEFGGGGIQCNNMTVLFHDMYIIKCTLMRMVFKSRVCVCVNWSPSSSRIFMHVDFPGNVKYKSPRKCLHAVCMISPWFACIYPANIAPYFVLNNFNAIVKPMYTARK